MYMFRENFITKKQISIVSNATLNLQIESSSVTNELEVSDILPLLDSERYQKINLDNKLLLIK